MKPGRIFFPRAYLAPALASLCVFWLMPGIKADAGCARGPEPDGICQLEAYGMLSDLSRAVREGRSVEEIALEIEDAADVPLDTFGGFVSRGLDAADGNGSTALHFALACHPEQEKVARMLIEAGADITARTGEGTCRDVLFLDDGDKLPGSVPALAARYARTPAVLETLERLGVSFATTDRPSSPVLNALGNPNPDVLRFLLERGAMLPDDLPQSNIYVTLLAHALERESPPEVARVLLERAGSEELSQSDLLPRAIAMDSSLVPILVEYRAGDLEKARKVAAQYNREHTIRILKIP